MKLWYLYDAEAWSGRVKQLLSGIASQGLSSVGNLLLAVMIARAATSADLGGWSIAFAGYSAALILSRAVVTTPFLVDRSGSRDEPGTVGLAAALGTGVGALMLLGSSAAGDSIGASMLVLGIGMPALMTQDALRLVFIRQQKAHLTAAIDLVWLGLQLVGFLAVTSIEDMGPPAVTLTTAWVLASAASTSVGLLIWGRYPRPIRGVVSVYRDTRVSVLLGVEAGLSALAVIMVPVLVAAIAGFEAAGALRAATTLMGGVALLVAGLTPVVTVEATKRVMNVTPMDALARNWILLIAASSAVYGLAMTLLPEEGGRALVGDSWPGAVSILFPLILHAMLRGPFTVVPILFRVRHQFAQLLELRIHMTLLNTAIPVLGSVFAGLEGAAWGLALAAAANNVQCWRAERRLRSG